MGRNNEQQKVLDVVLTPDRQLFYAHDNNFGIFACTMPERDRTEDSEFIKMNDFENFTIKGSSPELEHGKKYRAKLVEKWDSKYKSYNYEIQSIYEELPTDREGQKSFLSAVITQRQVIEIFNVYTGDENIIDMIKEDTFDYDKVDGLGEKTYQNMRQKVLQNIEYRHAIIELCEQYGLTHNAVKKMSDSYGSPSLLVEKVKENPYIIADDVDGIGFKKADAIALRSGIDKKSPKRLESAIIYVLKQEANNGHSWLTLKGLSSGVASETNLRKQTVLDFLNDIDTNINRVYRDGNRIALLSNYEAEQGVYEHIERLLDIENNYQITGVDDKIAEAELQQGFSFTHEQHEAIETAIKKNVMVINGKAGTGKTSVLKGVLHVLTSGRNDLKYMTCALSGKASQRIQESTGLDSATIHRLLGYHPSEGFQFDEYNPLESDVIVLDEASMVNAPLMSSLVRAVKDGAKLIILGDTAQLEPIGVGNCLLDMINSGKVPRVELTIVHRQAQKSGILSVANQVREGKAFVGKGDFQRKKLGELKDLIFFPYRNADSVLKTTLDIAKKYEGDILDFQVIVPLKTRGKLSTSNLNEKLQEIFNPIDEDDVVNTPFIKKGKVKYIEGDKVIQNGNDYDKGVFNGTIGVIKEINKTRTVLYVEFEGVGRVEYQKDELKQLDLAYALTVHRTQGSQFKNVLFAIDYSAYVLLNRQLLYTALTRAMTTCFFIGELDAVLHSIRTDKSTKRNTFLEEMLIAS